MANTLDNNAIGEGLRSALAPVGHSGSQEMLAQQKRVAAALTPKLTLAFGTEAANVIEATLALKNGAGVAITEAAHVRIQIFEAATGLAAAVAAVSATVTTGTAILGDALPHGIFETTAAGALVLDITDEAGASGKTFWVFAQVTGVNGAVAYGTVTFD